MESQQAIWPVRELHHGPRRKKIPKIRPSRLAVMVTSVKRRPVPPQNPNDCAIDGVLRRDRKLPPHPPKEETGGACAPLCNCSAEHSRPRCNPHRYSACARMERCLGGGHGLRPSVGARLDHVPTLPRSRLARRLPPSRNCTANEADENSRGRQHGRALQFA
jgi:hypothetical protein